MHAQGATALHLAGHHGWPAVISALARAPGADLDARDAGGRTPLHAAAAQGRVEAVNELWSRGCAIEPVDAAGWTRESGFPGMTFHPSTMPCTWDPTWCSQGRLHVCVLPLAKGA